MCSFHDATTASRPKEATWIDTNDTKFMYIIIHVIHLIIVHFNKNTFDRIIYADIKLNPKSLNWQILKMKICVFSSPCK